MPHEGFPSLTTNSSDPLYNIDQLGTHPECWTSVPIPELGNALVVYAMLWARGGQPDAFTQPLVLLHSTFEQRGSEEDRLGVLQAIAFHVEEAARRLQSGNFAAALMPFLTDPSPLVMSSAALAMAGLASTSESDEMAGPRLVAGFANQFTNQQQRAACLAGLLALGDSRVTALLEGCWRNLDDQARGLLVQLPTGRCPTPCIVDFFLRWAEEVAASEDEGRDGLGHALAGLARLGRLAEQVGPDGEQLGVMELDRGFPVWSRPPDSVVNLVHRWTKEQFATSIESRLVDIAKRERAPRVAPTMLREWGLPDVPHVEAVARAVEPLVNAAARLTVFEAPVEIDVRPVHDQPNQLIEWGIINPNGPTMCQFALVDVGSGYHALVWTLHHFLLPECLAFAVGHFNEPAVLHEALARVFAANGHPEKPLFKSLSHWVRLSEGSSLDLDTVAALIGSAHRRRLESEGLKGEHPDAGLAHLWRLARNPVEECRREQERAFEDWGPVTKALLAGEKDTATALMEELEQRHVLPELPDDDAYRRWLLFASEPAYVEKIRSYFESARTEAIRRYNAGRESPVTQDTPTERNDSESVG